MEVTVLGAEKTPSNAVIAVQVGASPLRQASIEVGRPILVPRPGDTGAALPVETFLFGQLGSGNLPEGTTDSTCRIPVTLPDGKTKSEVTLRVRSTSGSGSADEKLAPLSPTAKMSSEYLDRHDLQVHIQGLIEEVLREQPVDPWRYMITQLQKRKDEDGGNTAAPAAAPAAPAVAASGAPKVIVPTPPAAPKPDKPAPARPGVNNVAAPAMTISVTAAPKVPSNMTLGLCAPSNKRNSKDMLTQGRQLAKQMGRATVQLAYRASIRLEAHRMARSTLGMSYASMVKKYPKKIVSGPRQNIILIFGPPASGKGTHGQKIENKLNIPQLATGDMLREAVSKGTEIGKKAKAVMDAGGLVSDDIVIGIIKDRITYHDCRNGFVLDGFPRTVEQAKALDIMLLDKKEKVLCVVELNVPDEVLIERIGGRWIHKSSGRSYHTKHNPPKSYDGKSEPSVANMKDDATGEPLMQRADDNKDALPKRLQNYHAETEPILGHYGKASDCKVSKVDANLSESRKTENIWADVSKALGL